MRKRKSLSYIHKSGNVPHSWILDNERSVIATDALLKFCSNRIHGNIKGVTVYRKPNDNGYLGRCFWLSKIICLQRNPTVKTLAHEIAHFAFHSHGVKHEELTLEIEKYLIERYYKQEVA